MDQQHYHRGSAPPNPYMYNMAELAQQQQQYGNHQAVYNPFTYPVAGIDYPGMNDVMCGRGGGTNNHIGNIRFRQLVNEHKLRYLAATKVEKPKVAMEVVQMWRALNPPGRFLTKTDPSQGDDSLWHDVGDKKAREKASQCLRERTPDVLPFVKQLQIQEEEKKKEQEKGKSAEDKTGEKDSGAKGIVLEKERNAKAEPAKVPNENEKTAATLTDAEATALYAAALDDQSGGDKAEEVTGRGQRGATSRASAPVIHTPFSVGSSTNIDQEQWGFPQKSAVERRRSREILASSVPVAASLMEDCFADDDDDHEVVQVSNGGKERGGELTMEAYQQSLEDFLLTTPSGDGGAAPDADDRSNMMDALSTTSWLKSFKSIESASMMSVGNSLRNIKEEGDDDVHQGAAGFRPTMPNSSEPASRSQKMKIVQAGTAQHSNMSMLSDFSDFSSRKGSTRSMKMGGARGTSQMSMLSELTDISETLNALDLTKEDEQS